MLVFAVATLAKRSDDDEWKEYKVRLFFNE